jgi:hypothetical protein
VLIHLFDRDLVEPQEQTGMVQTWPRLPVARQRFLLGLAVHQVWAFSTDKRLEERAVVVMAWRGAASANWNLMNVRRDDGHLAVVIRHRVEAGDAPVSLLSEPGGEPL